MIREHIKSTKFLYYPLKTIKNIYNHGKYQYSLRYISENIKRVRNKINNDEILNVVFVVQYIPGWNKLEPIYKRMKEHSSFNPIIVCVPSNIQNYVILDETHNDTYDYFVQHGYNSINAFVDGSWLDLKKLKPDYLFHSRPYNDFMPKEYCSKSIVKYALICNVMYGANFSYNEQDVTLNRDYYEDVFIYFSFDSNEAKFYSERFNNGINKQIQKVLPYGATGLEQILNSKFDYHDNYFDKTVLWTPRWSTDLYIGGSNFFKYKDLIIKLAKDYPTVKFILRPHPLMFGNFIKTGQMSEVEVNEFKHYIEKEKNLELNESKEYFDIFWKSDFIIADLSGIVPEYFITGKPIIYCQSNANFRYVEYSKAILQSSYSVWNQFELEKIVKRLISDNDDKKNEREQCIIKYFNKVNKNSENIVKSLLNI